MTNIIKNALENALEYPKLKKEYEALLQKHLALKDSHFTREFDNVGMRYEDAIQDMNILLLQYKNNQAMLSVIAPIIEYLKQSFFERAQAKTNKAAVKKKRPAAKLSDKKQNHGSKKTNKKSGK